MDEALLERYRQGDPGAAMSLRNHLRAIASRVLDAPQWGIDSPSERRRLEMDTAETALSSGASSLVELVAITLAGAAERGLEAMRVAQTHIGGDHVPARHMVRLAMEETPSPQMAGFLKHIETCKACEHDLKTVQEVLRSATSAQAAAAPRAQAAAPRAAPGDGARPKAPRAPTGAARPAPRARPKIETTPRQPSSSGLLKPAIGMAVVIAITAGIWLSRSKPQRIAANREAYAALLPSEIPPTAHADELSGAARDAVLRMRDGGCQAASDRLLTEGLRHPDNLWLKYYEGLAFVCIRDGPRARAALEAVGELPGEKPYGYSWWLAQALVLDGDIDGALRELDALAADPSHARSADARALAARIREI